MSEVATRFKFSVSSTELLRQLQIVNGAISSSPVLPILADFLFTLRQRTLTIAASDTENTIVTTLEVNGEADGSVAVPAKILMDTLKELPQQPVTFSVNEDNFSIEITSAYGKYRLAGEDGSEFPKLPEVAPEMDHVKVESAHLSKGIAKPIFATSNDELRPAMTGVYFQIDFNKVTMVATDAHKLVRFSFAQVDGQVSTSFIIPKKALNLLKNALPNSGEVTISFAENSAFFIFGNITLSCRLIEARYPDYNAVIPVNNPNNLSISRSDFQNSLKRIAIYSNKTTNQVVLNMSEGSLHISAQDLDFSNEANEQLNCEYQGSPMNIAFNARFLIDMLAAMETDEVKMELSTPSRASILLPSEQKDGEDMMMLVMPVMMSN
jgi:DNA polymerase-3 subunit beta